MGTATNVVHGGPGTIYVAPIGTTEPTDATTALPVAWKAVGYTDSGITVSIPYALEPVEVAEETEPIAYDSAASATTTVAFTMAEATAINLDLMLNKGVDSATPASVEPPDLGSEVRVMIVHQTVSGARWIFRRAINGGTAEITGVRAPGKRLLAVTFNLEKPASAKKFKVYPDTNGLI